MNLTDRGQFSLASEAAGLPPSPVSCVETQTELHNVCEHACDCGKRISRRPTVCIGCH